MYSLISVILSSKLMNDERDAGNKNSYSINAFSLAIPSSVDFFFSRSVSFNFSYLEVKFFTEILNRIIVEM